MLATLLSIIAILSAVVLGLFTVFRRQKRSLGDWFLVAGLLSLTVIEGADRVALNAPELWKTAKSVALVSESLLSASWLLFAHTFARKKAFHNLSPFSWILLVGSLSLPLVVLLSPYESFFFSPDFADESIIFVSRYAYWFYLCVLFFTAIALYQLERTLIAFSSVERSRVLYEVLGTGLILVTMLVYYSQVLLHRTIDMNLIPIRSLAMIIGIGLCGYSHLRQESLNSLVVSRDVASRSVVVLAVGCYLLLLGGAGEGLRYFGLQNQRLVFIGFAFISGLVVVLMLLSEKNRRKLTVFLHKHFYRHKYDYRNEWLRFTSQLSSADNMEKLQNAILTFYCETFGRKGASLYLMDADSGIYQQKSSIYMEFPQSCFYKDHPLILYFNETDWVFNVDDQLSSQFNKIKHQFEPFKVKLCVPLQYEQNLQGFVLLGEAVNPDETLNFEDFDLMKVLASQATSMLLSLKLTAQLSTAQEMAAIGKVSTFIIHDLKNHVSNLTLMVDNARDHMDNPEFQADMLVTLDDTIGKVKGLIARLKNIKEKKDLQLVHCDLVAVVRRAVRSAGIHPEMVCGDEVSAYLDAEEIEKVIHNMVLNAHEAGSENGSVAVSVGRGETVYFEISDQGCGMSDDFIRNRLFQPFQTTKQKGFGIGLYQCRQIIESHGGKIEVSSKVGKGTSFKVHLRGVAP
jgi:putative PEP-CTERM system histidine kinase